jgi:hypothetical protein
MSQVHSKTIEFAESELLAAARLVEARLADPADEACRIEITRRFLAAAMSVEHALRAQTRCALVNHCGSLGTSNLSEATERLFEALFTYSALIREIADRSRNFLTCPAQVETKLKLEVA